MQWGFIQPSIYRSPYASMLHRKWRSPRREDSHRLRAAVWQVWRRMLVAGELVGHDFNKHVALLRPTHKIGHCENREMWFRCAQPCQICRPNLWFFFFWWKIDGTVFSILTLIAHGARMTSSFRADPRQQRRYITSRERRLPVACHKTTHRESIWLRITHQRL